MPGCRWPAGRWIEVELRDPLRDIPRRAARTVGQDHDRETLLGISKDAVREAPAFSVMTQSHCAMVAIDEPSETVFGRLTAAEHGRSPRELLRLCANERVLLERTIPLREIGSG